MPLIKGKSRSSFEKNFHTEMEEGKSKPQSLAIAYNMKRRAQHRAHGGMMTHDGYQSSCTEHCNSPCEVHPKANLPMEHEGDDVKSSYAAMKEDDRKLNQHGEEEEGPQGIRMKEGGFLGEITSEKPGDVLKGIGSIFADGGEVDDEDMVGRIMAQRQRMYSKGATQPQIPQRMYSKGGRVANEDEIAADFMPNGFDDLHLRDDLESSYTGTNSGDYLSTPEEDERRRDMVSRIMASRKKRDRNPNPA